MFHTRILVHKEIRLLLTWLDVRTQDPWLLFKNCWVWIWAQLRFYDQKNQKLFFKMQSVFVVRLNFVLEYILLLSQPEKRGVLCNNCAMKMKFDKVTDYQREGTVSWWSVRPSYMEAYAYVFVNRHHIKVGIRLREWRRIIMNEPEIK